MSVSSINSGNLLSSVLSAAYSNSARNTGYSSSSGSDNADISTMGSLMSAMSSMSEDDQSSIKSFMDDIKSSVEDGTFDAETAAEEAPDALKTYAEENGIDLTELVQDMADASQGSGVYGPPPPPPDDSATGSNLDLSSLEDLSDEEKSEVQAFMETLKSSLEDGTFDAETLAESAPDVLNSLAEENGMSLSELVQELADEANNAPPPPTEASGVIK